MKNYMLLLLLCLLLGSLPGHAQDKSATLRGKITDEQGNPLPGANLFLLQSRSGAVTDTEGLFSLEVPAEAYQMGDTLRISYLGYVTESMPLPEGNYLEVALMPDIATLMEVEVVSTGYQQLPRERATGSFVQVDEELINRSVGPDILSRLEGVASGVLFSPYGSGSDITIRGRSTLFANEEPLIVVDNFPYEGNISNINPNDVESITVLKDAAAASIWGARAGNGVIVITTKGGRFTQAPRLCFNSNLTIGQQPDAFYVPRMSTADFIATERALFEAGYYNFAESAYDKLPLTPLVELLIDQREGRISAEALQGEIERLQQEDVRRDFADYLYRPIVRQQYAASLSGGDERQRYYLSAGWDKNLERLVGEQNSRVTLNAKNNWTFFSNKLRLGADIYYAQRGEEKNGLDPLFLRQSTHDGLPPYSRLADDAGQPLVLIKDYRLGFVEQAEAAGLLNWRYSPLQERELLDKTAAGTDFRTRLEAGYQLLPSLEASVFYQYWSGQQIDRDHYPEESYFARDLVNRFTQVGADGTLSRPIPVGGVLDERMLLSASHNLRAQLQYSETFWERHELNALAGWEARGVETRSSSFRYYGYQESKALQAAVDAATLFPQYHYPGRRLAIPNGQDLNILHDRFLSYYANASYAYDRRYLLTLSARKDQSNLFGVEANQRGVPLWSAGMGWNLHGEGFYRWKALPYLKLRATYGYNGNIDKSVSAFTTARLLGNSWDTRLPYAGITNPPNPALQWERVEILNLGLDFASHNNRLSGSLEYYRKNGKDLIGYAPVSPVTGLSEFRGNVAATEGQGLDLQLSSLNVEGPFRWQTDWLYSYAATTVTDYRAEVPAYLLLQNGVFPREGFPPRALYSYRWGGLNPDTGNPQGFLDGEISEDYGAIIGNMEPDSLIYHGSLQPTHFGALRNTFSWKGFSLSCNITYRLGYYFRRESIRYGTNRGLGGHGDYAYRWQQPGDEAFTQVPSIPVQGSSYRDDFYTYSEVLVEKGDHVRLQDVRLSYTLGRELWPGLPFRELQVYGYASNLGILWIATSAVPDPDYRNMPAPRSWSMGVRANF